MSGYLHGFCMGTCKGLWRLRASELQLLSALRCQVSAQVQGGEVMKFQSIFNFWLHTIYPFK